MKMMNLLNHKLNKHQMDLKHPFSILLIAFCLLASLAASKPIHADTIIRLPDKDYSQVTDNQEYIFVMFANAEDSVQVPHIRNIYSVSGLYKNDNSTTPLWSVDWYAHKVYLSNDGEHLIRPVSHTSPEGIAFYKNGLEIKNYSIADLVATPNLLPHSFSLFFWVREINFDPNRNLLTLEVLASSDMLNAEEDAMLSENAGEMYTFDASSGEILSASLRVTNEGRVRIPSSLFPNPLTVIDLQDDKQILARNDSNRWVNWTGNLSFEIILSLLLLICLLLLIKQAFQIRNLANIISREMDVT